MKNAGVARPQRPLYTWRNCVAMAVKEMTGPLPKKARRSTPLVRVTAEDRAKQFKTKLYADDRVLFYRYCDHSFDFTRIDTVKDHLKSKKHTTRKQAKESNSSSTSLCGPSTSRQATLGTVLKSKDLREEFVLDYLKMCTLADILLEKTNKIRPFLEKHCKQAGAIPNVPTLRSTCTYVPR